MAICGIVVVELVHGARTNKEIDEVIEALDCFNLVPISDNDWIGIGKLLNKLRMNGLSIPFQDAVLSFIALKKDVPIWTNDRHFDLIKNIIEELKIFKII